MGIVVSTLEARRLVADVRKGRAGAQQVAHKLEQRPALLKLRKLSHHECLVHAVAAAGNADVLRCLLHFAESAAADVCADPHTLVNAKNARGQTPLMLASGNPGGAECVRLLLAAGADPWAADVCGGRTALFYAAISNAADSAAALLEATAGHTLPNARFPNSTSTTYVDVRMLAGFTALHVAVIADAQAATRVMLRYRPRIATPTLFGSYDFITCPRGTCPIHLAARHGRSDLAKMLLLAHASIGARATNAVDQRVLLDDYGRLPCHLAALNGHDELALMLQPGVPLSQALGAVDDRYLYLTGPAPLKLLAAAALRGHQKATLAAARRALGLEAGEGTAVASGCAAGCPAAAAAAAAGAPAGGQRLHMATACDPAREAAHRKGSGFEVPPAAACCSCDRGAGPVDANGAPGQEAERAAPAPGGGAADCAAAGEVAAEEDSCCGVCLDAPPCVRLSHCGHKMCASCCTSLFGMLHSEVVACPFCRNPVGAFNAVAY